MWLLWDGDAVLRTDRSWANTDSINTREKASEKIQAGDDDDLNLTSSTGSGQEWLLDIFLTRCIYLFVLFCSTDIMFFT